jgi:hypothetical protein
MLWSRTLRSPPSVSKAQKRRLGDWVFWDSRIGPHPSPVHQRSCPQDLSACPLVAYSAQEGVVRQGVVRISRNVDRLYREGVQHVQEATDVVGVRVADHDTVEGVDAPGAQEVHDVRSLLRSSCIDEITLATGLHEHAVSLANVDEAYG